MKIELLVIDFNIPSTTQGHFRARSHRAMKIELLVIDFNIPSTTQDHLRMTKRDQYKKFTKTNDKM